MKSVELAKLPRKQGKECNIPDTIKDEKGSTETGDDKARSRPNRKKEEEDSTREKLVRDANKQPTIKPFNISRIKGNESKREASIKCEANGSHDNNRNVEKISEKTTIQKKKVLLTK